MQAVIEKKKLSVQVRELSRTEAEYWDQEIQRFEWCHPLNAFAWGEVRSVDNWNPIYLAAEREETFCGGMMVLEKKIPFTPFSIFYSPKGPVWDYEDGETLYFLIDKVKALARKKKAIFLRIDPNLPEGIVNGNEDKFRLLGFRHLRQRWTYWNSPRDVSRIDLTKVNSAGELFNLLDRDTRRCIRKSFREGVRIEPAISEKELETFYNIFKEFSVSKRFMSRDYEYQKMLWNGYIAKGMGRLFLARYRGEIIGGLICIKFGRKCVAMHMGTPYKYQKLQTYYAYVWESIKWAKENGCLWYSFRGVGTTPSQEYFKRKFLPEVVSLRGYFDLPFQNFIYQIVFTCEFYLLPPAIVALTTLRKIANTISK